MRLSNFLTFAFASAETGNQPLAGEAHFFAARSPLDVPRLSTVGRIGKSVLEARVGYDVPQEAQQISARAAAVPNYLAACKALADRNAPVPAH